MLRAVESSRKRYLGFRPLQNPDSRSQPLHAVLSLQVKHCALAALLHPESIRRNIETDTLPIIPDFHGSGSACDSTGGYGFSAARATRTAAGSLAFRIRNRKNRPVHRAGPRL